MNNTLWEKCLDTKLLFVLGKGGVGRTSVSTSIAAKAASLGRRSLLVQWSMTDVVGQHIYNSYVDHQAKEVHPNLWVMNFNPQEAIKEYFVKYLKLKLLYSVAIENRHVQKLIQAAPGVHELFFLGRLYWLTELAYDSTSVPFDNIVIDTPATGHGLGLFSIPETVAGFGLTGPIAAECKKVLALLADPEKVGSLFVTLPEELPVQETLEGISTYNNIMHRNPLGIVVNRALDSSLQASISDITELKGEEKGTAAQHESLLNSLRKRNEYTKAVQEKSGLQTAQLPDAFFTVPSPDQRSVVEHMIKSME